MTVIKNRRGTVSQWTAANPVLAEGEIGFETDTGKHKIGNGVSAWLGLHYFVDESGLLTSFAPRGAGFLPDAGAQVLAFDDFRRSNRTLPGDVTPSGHIWRASGNTLAITGHHLVSAPSGVGSAEIAYLQHDRNFTQISAEGVFIAGTTGGANAIVGACPHDFGHAPGAVQLAIYAATTGGGYDWELFVFPYGGTETIVASGTWAGGFTIASDGSTLYAFSMRRTGKNTVILSLPDGQVVEVTDSRISTYWGVSAGFQLRRQASTDGYFNFTRVATTAPRLPVTPQYVPGAIVRTLGATTDFFSCPAPAAGWGITDLDVRGIVNLDDYTLGVDLASVWDADHNARSFAVGITTTKKLKLNVSLDGTTSLSALSTGTSPLTNGSPIVWAVTRLASTGDVDFYTSTNPAALDLPVGNAAWTHLGATQTTTAGAPYNSKAPLNVAHDDTAALPMTGTLTAARLLASIGGAKLADFDLRATWTFLDSVGNQWLAYGSAWTWVVSLAGYAPLASPALTGSPTINGAPIPLARGQLLKPSGVVRETVERAFAPTIVAAGLSALTSGTLHLCAIPLAAGDVVSSITFMAGTTAAVTPTHWWFGLFDSSRNLLAVTADQTTTAIAASSTQTLNIATIASGAAASFTVPSTGLYYVGIMVAAGTVPTILGSSATASAVLNRNTKLVGPTSDTGLTTPPAFPFTAGAIASGGNYLYASVN